MRLPETRAEPVAIWKARKYIEEHSGEELSLTKVAKTVKLIRRIILAKNSSK